MLPALLVRARLVVRDGLLRCPGAAPYVEPLHATSRSMLAVFANLERKTSLALPSSMYSPLSDFVDSPLPDGPGTVDDT